MSRRLELIREEKLFRLLPGRTKRTRLEASGAALVDDSTALVKRQPRHALLPAPSLGSGFEDVCIDHRDRRVFCSSSRWRTSMGSFAGLSPSMMIAGASSVVLGCGRDKFVACGGPARSSSPCPLTATVARRTYREPAYNCAMLTVCIAGTLACPFTGGLPRIRRVRIGSWLVLINNGLRWSGGIMLFGRTA